jgi:putative membrane protein
MRKAITITTAIVLSVGATLAARAQAPTNSSTDPSAAPTSRQKSATQSHWGEGAADGRSLDPATFVTEAAQGGLTEVAVSKAAEASSQDPKVKRFAAQMVSDHTKANDELASLAKSKGLRVPTSLDAKHQAVVQKLSNQKGAEFDAAYGRQMKEDHAKTVALFQAATQTSDPDLAAFAKKTLPTLEEHKHMAGELPGAMHTAQARDKTTTQ